MPEYLAPGVYVEEIDTGSKPIEGVSTSTSGMVGVTERGPVNIPVLVTSFGEFQRWFGGYLNPADFPDEDETRPLRYLPHAVEGFFTNGGKRVYVVRVLDIAQAQNASTFLFDRASATSASTRLFVKVAGGSSNIYVADGTGLAVNNWLQVGDGSNAEFQQVGALPTTANDIATRIPLAFEHGTGITLNRYPPFPVPAGSPPTTPFLTSAVSPGAMQINVTGASVPAIIPAGTILRLGKTDNGDEEYVITADPSPTGAAARVVTLSTPVMLAHPGGASETVGIMPALTPPPPPATDITTLASPASAGESALFVNANRASFLTGNDIVQIVDAPRTEIRRLARPGILSLEVGAYADYPVGSIIEAVTLPNDAAGSPKKLTGVATAASNVLNLDNREGLNVGDVLRVGSAADTDAEYLTIQALPNRLPGPDAGQVLLASVLQREYIKDTEVRRQTLPIARSAPGPIATILPTRRNDSSIITSAGTGFAPTFIRVNVGSSSFYHKLSGASAAISPAPVTLKLPLDLPHVVGEPVAARNPLLLVKALDAGIWGNRLRVSVQDQETPLVRTKVRAVLDSTHIKLDSATGVEAGTVLEHTAADGITTTQVKVRRLDRQNDSLITLEATLPPGSAVGDVVRSREFELNVYLMRQPDPAVPTRSDSVMDAENFRNLSMDSRHSRYIHKVIGTTWDSSVPTTVNDDDDNPLRLADRRSEGESSYIRVRDLAQDLTEPTRTTTLESVRLGPELLVETLPSGTKRPARRRLARGDDRVASIHDDTYKGEDNPEPNNRMGLASLRNEEEIAIVAVPGRTSAALQGALIDHCELMRYRFAVLDGPPPPKDSLNNVQTQRQQFDSKYAALYHPWVLIPHPYPVTLTQVPNYPVPPSGHVVGVYARTDIERGVHKSPANEVVRGIIGLKRSLNKGEQDILNPFPVNINVIRDFRLDNRGIRVYGGRVITSDPDWKYVNVRRLLIFIENSLDRGLQWVVFEPNAEPLWARVRRSISNFLTVVWRNGALEGTTREEAYFVKCDRTTMTQTDIDNGRLIVVIGVAPVKPAEFVIIRIGLWTAHAED